MSCTSADYAQSGVGGRGEEVGSELGMGPSEPGTLGQMDSGEERYTDSGGYGGSFEDEPPLLQELGIDFQLIKQKVCIYNLIRLSMLYPLHCHFPDAVSVEPNAAHRSADHQ